MTERNDKSWPFRTIIEPFRIKAVEAIPILTRQEREQALDLAGHNLFELPADKVTIDLLTDSGTGAMSAKQWSALMLGDESYAGSRSFFKFQDVVRELTGYPHVFPVHQGRAAERILARTLISQEKNVVLSNTHFDTTRAHVEQAGALALDLPVPEALNPMEESQFKGNIDLGALKEALNTYRGRVAFVIMTLTNNAMGGQPVSMENLKGVSELCREAGVLFFVDAARFSENAWFIHTQEPGYAEVALAEIVRQTFQLADGCWISAKKDGIVHIGGVLATQRADLVDGFRNELILCEGFPTYGGLAGRDLEALAVGLKESLDIDYMRYRIRSVAYFAEGLQKIGIPVVRPPGGHAVFVDAGALLSHLTPEQFPGQALGAAFYLEGGIRGVEVGSLMFPDARLQLLRLAVPRRVYTQAHIDYVLEVAEEVKAKAPGLPGYRIVEEPPFLRHFTAKLAPL